MEVSVEKEFKGRWAYSITEDPVMYIVDNYNGSGKRGSIIERMFVLRRMFDSNSIKLSLGKRNNVT